MIKVSEGNCKEESKGFPKLMKGTKTGVIILAMGMGTYHLKGVVIKPSEGMGEQYYSESWDPDYFEDYNRPLTLQNC